MKILLSPGFGAGWATWGTNKKALAEDAVLVALVERGEHKGKTTVGALRAAGVEIDESFPDDYKIDCSLAFAKRAVEVECGELPYFGGLKNIEVREVGGRYRIDEYDGSETLVTTDDWW